MIILGIDPGSRRTGFGIIEFRDRPRCLEAGVLRLKETDPFANRLHQLYLGLNQIYQQFRPDVTVIEKIFFGKNADSAFKLGHARGICLMAAAEGGSAIEEYAAKYVKKAVTGTGAASKEHVRLIVTQVLRYQPTTQDLDVSDALALALCHTHALEVKRQLARALVGTNL
jgi:crossover junction endodeoxyribonuclease RuvC